MPQPKISVQIILKYLSRIKHFPETLGKNLGKNVANSDKNTHFLAESFEKNRPTKSSKTDPTKKFLQDENSR